MGKWEQVARLVVAQAQLRDPEGAIAAALAQCEADTIRRCSEVCDEQAAEFLSPEYATDQPLSSFSERFACGEVKKAILALLPKEVGE